MFLLFRPCRGLANYDVIKIWPSDRDSQALDTLTILLSDGATVGFFRLGHLWGVLDTVVEHFRRNLINVFKVLRESEIHTGIPERLAYGNTKEIKDKQFSDVLPD